ncbi:MAG: polysaccharide biosynthesis protein [Candidatus Margulisbacteria bacterium]|nr:polysaccharide biosynthesis protein [Candidatus Margulisiibacteriota bacterium]
MLSIAFRIGTFRNFGLYHWAWQYMSVREVVALIKAVLLSTAFLALTVVAFGNRDFPLAVFVVEGLICFAFIGGVRLAIRYWKDAHSLLSRTGEEQRVLIVGAGDAGEMILREIQKNPKFKYHPVGFVDNNPNKKGLFIHHLPVLGDCESIPAIVEANGVDEVIIAIPTATRKQIRRVVELCEQSKAKFKIVPGIFELIDGTVHVNQIRNVEIEDLLGRDPIKLDMESISSYLTNSCVMVTGAGGSIGSELCRQVAIYNPAKLVLIGKGENSIFDIENELKGRYPFLDLSVHIADVRDLDRMTNVFEAVKPDVIFHAAAHKHVMLMERDPEEAILNNVVGTRNLVDLADRYQAKEFVMISTDKAVNPSSVMGATKRLAEMIVQAKAQSGTKTKFVSVRFGNVLGSRGSVVPIFKRQIAAGDPVTVTHPEAKRYFMTIPEAVQLVIQAGALGNGGEIFILDMGEPVKIVDLARDLIRLSGFEEGTDIEIKFIGLKPGEKLFEEILTSEEGSSATKHEKIFVSPSLEIAGEKLREDVLALEQLARAGKKAEIRNKIKEMIPLFKGGAI